MIEPQTPEEFATLDEAWAEFGASDRVPAPAPAGQTTDANDSPAVATRRQMAGCLVFVAVVGSCDFLLISRWNAAAPIWPIVLSGSIAALGGAIAGFLLAPRHPLPGLLAGVCSGAGSVYGTAWALSRLTGSNLAIVAVVALAGSLPGIGGFYSLRWLQQRGRIWQPSTAPGSGLSRPHSPHFAVIYTLPPEAPHPQEAPLEERLLHLCKEDRRLFHRLLDHERTQHPGSRRVELLRLAIEHFDRDNS